MANACLPKARPYSQYETYYLIESSHQASEVGSYNFQFTNEKTDAQKGKVTHIVVGLLPQMESTGNTTPNLTLVIKTG